MVEKLLKEKEEKIDNLEKMLNESNNLDNILNEELVKITLEIDDKGKKKYSNADFRTEELKKRCGKQHEEREQLKIDIEIQRLRIGLLTERIKFYSK